LIEREEYNIAIPRLSRPHAKENQGFVIILSLDTTTRAGSAAVLRADVVLAEVAGESDATHGERLPGELMRALEQAGLRIEDVELFAVAAGPGSFTGLRVGIATIQGLAMARARRVVPVSALEALAHGAINAHHPIATWMDAQRGEVFSALYAPDGRDVLIAPESASPQTLLDVWRTAPQCTRTPIFVGDGAVRYGDAIVRRFGNAAEVRQPPPLAALIGQIAAREPHRAVAPHAVVPVYIRKTDAELARARRAAGG
jgi:tRNA threonylcarbamoyladenosine biosynthesis protein TsaB